MAYIKQVHLFVFDGFAEHEVALALRELHRAERFDVVVSGLDHRAVKSMSGLRVVPDIPCDEIQPERAGLFLLPGGDLWEQPARNARFDSMTHRATDMLQGFEAAGVPVAASGSATLALARAGLLDGVSHTSDGQEYLRSHIAGWPLSPFYVATQAINDENIITASSSGSVELAHELIKQFELYDETDRAAWLARHGHGSRQRASSQRRVA